MLKGRPKNFPAYEDVKEVQPDAVPPFIIKPPPKPAASAIQRKGTGWIHPNLPQFPLTLIILGPRKRGKSVALRNYLDPTNHGSYGSALHKLNIIIYSPTKEYDDTLTSLEYKNTCGPPDDLTAIVADLFRQQESYKNQNNMADVLLVIEDCTVVNEAWDLLRYLGYSGRHYGIHSIAVCHKLTAVDRGIRTQQQQWMIFRPHEESERESILESFSSRGPSRDIWRRALYRAWQIPFNFVYIDFERGGDIRQVYRSGLNQPLFTDEEISMLQFYEENGYKVHQRPVPITSDQVEHTRIAQLVKSKVTPSVVNDNVTESKPKRKRGRPRKYHSIHSLQYKTCQ